MSYKCVCGKDFSTYRKMTGHMANCQIYLQHKKIIENEYQSKCTIECSGCHKKFIDNNSLWAHLSHCKLYTKTKQNNKIDKYKQLDGTFKCKCGKIFNEINSFCGHLSWCNNLKHKTTSHKAWNKGLSKSDPRILSISIKLKQKYKNGEIVPSWLNKKMSNEMKENIRKAALKRKIPRTTKRTEKYICKDGSIVNLDSSYERNLAKLLDNNNINWIRPEPLKWYSNDGSVHHYFPDFYLTEYKIYLDPKNEYCFNVQKDKIEYISKHYNNCYFLHKEQINIKYIKKLIGVV